MHLQGVSFSFLLPALALAASPALLPRAPPLVRDPSSSLQPRDPWPLVDVPRALPFDRRDGDHAHAHAHHDQPLVEFNETEFLLTHQHVPPSYWSIDFEEPDPEHSRHPGFMLMHILAMSAAFFVALPAGIALRSVNHPWHGFSVISFWALVLLGCASSGIYRKLTPDMYEGQKHSSQSYFIIFLALIVSAVDIVAGLSRLWSYIRLLRSGADRFSLRTFWRQVILGQDDRQALGVGAEYTNLVVEEPEDIDEDDLKAHLRRPERHVEFVQTEDLQDRDDPAGWHNHDYPETPNSERTVFGPRSPRGSQFSDDTLHVGSSTVAGKTSLLRRIGRIVFATLERILVFAAFGQFMFGIIVYTGGCRGYYVNGCLAHVIKGGIFWCYGLVTFARFLGSFSELGWAWNRPPSGTYVSAEFVESAVIFTYGITNTWMERFGAHPGDPYTTKQVQHISIAVMFWFAGLVGMGLESRRLRRWLASVATASMAPRDRDRGAVAEPASYNGSFNPFPALVIGVTGAAMSAHFQKYLFQVQIHALWGYCLSAFAVLRCITYFFVWLSPPRSILPSRPPSEALTSFFLAMGGLVFVFSNEEITIAAMRRGHDDVMMFANVAVAITCFAFCWTLAVVGFKGWLKSRTHRAMSFHASA